VARTISDGSRPLSNLPDEHQKSSVRTRNGSKHELMVTPDKRSAAWASWKAAGEAATQDALDSLAAAGVNAVFERDGQLLERLPDGTIRPLDSAEKARET
jgi:hypothetical protein